MTRARSFDDPNASPQPCGSIPEDIPNELHHPLRSMLFIVVVFAFANSCAATCCEELGWGGGMYSSPIYGVGSSNTTQSFGSNDVCAQSKVGGACSEHISFFKAAKLCEEAGGRLCSADEVLNNEAHGSG